MPSLHLHNCCKRFGQVVAVDNVSLDLDEGRLLVLLGPSGCGKSTLLRLIAGLETLDRGEIYLGERRIDQLPPKDRHVAMVFQNYSLYPHMTVRRNLEFPLRVARATAPERDRRVAAMAGLLGLNDQLDKRPGQLSGGQRQRVALGRAMVREPDLFLLDEPLSNLDADLRRRMRTEIVRLQRELKVTTIHVTHDQTEALTMADQIVLLQQGRIAQAGTPQQLYREPASLYVAQFVGQPAINVIDLGAEGPLSRQLRSRLSRTEAGRSYERVVVGIRPEAVSIGADGDIDGEVVWREYLGDHWVIGVRVGSQILSSTWPVSEALP